MPIFNRITYGPVETKVIKYSHTPNVKDDGTQNGNYTNNMSTNDVVTIPGASKLHVKITYGGESANYDWVSVWQGAHSDYKAESDWSKAIPGAQKLGGGSHTDSSNTKEFDVDGDSVTFGFKSDSSVVGDGYGYYAVITADVTPGVTPDVTSEAYAVFDSSDGSFTFFRDDKGKYTDGQVSGTKTYYTGFEDITGETDPSWYNSDGYEQKNTIKTVVFKDKIKPKTCYDWFSDASSLTSITGLDKLDTSAVTDMENMFYYCSSLTSLDLSSFNTENVTNMGSMFCYCSLTSLDVSSFNTANVTNMRSMFYNCNKLTSLNLSSFNTAAVTSMSYMFYNCNKLTSLNLSSFNTAKVTDMNGMFQNCSSLTSLDLSSFNTENVTNMNGMFDSCSSLTSLDLSSFNTAKVTDMNGMFTYCSKLKTIYASSLFTTNVVSSSDNMFDGDTSLVGGAGTKYGVNHKDKAYARIDGGASNPGYFTAKAAPAKVSLQR